MSVSPSALIGLGTNVPFADLEGPALLGQALASLHQAGLKARAVSGVWRSAAWPKGSSQPDFHNAVAEVDPGSRNPGEIYDILRSVEAQFGRERRVRWGPRTLDLDILAMEGFVGAYGDLTLPHARLHDRAFVLAPLLQIAPSWRHPVLGLKVQELWLGLPEAEKGSVFAVT